METLEKPEIRTQKITLEDLMLQLLEKNFFEAHFKTVYMWIDVRPPYCDRGTFLWHCQSKDVSKITIDGADLFPRFYFNAHCMIIEINSWLVKRKIVTEET